MVPIYLLVDFLYFKVIKPTILCYCPNVGSAPLVCCLKSVQISIILFSLPSFCRVASKIAV